MRETVSDFRKLFFPYCLERQADGAYLVLNRRYLPVGCTGSQWVEHEGFAVRFKFKRALTAAQVVALSFDRNPAPERIYLYGDGCAPTSSAAAWLAYSQRLARLARYQVQH